MSQPKAFKDLNLHLLSTPFLILPDLKQPFEISIDASYYSIIAFLTQHGHSVAYNSETLFDFFHRYPTYDKDMYFIL